MFCYFAAERIDSLFLKGQLKVNGWPVWSDDGTDDLCDGMTGKMACPLKPGGNQCNQTLCRSPQGL